MRSVALIGIGFVAAATIFITTSVLIAWTGPASAPPNGNVDAPINVGTTDQVKNAGLSVNALAVFGNAILSGVSNYFNFGTTTGETGFGFRNNNGVMEYKDAGGEWIALNSMGGSSSNTDFVISSDLQNVNLYVLAGSPSTADTYTITINAGVTVGSANSATPALSTGVWPTGSVVTLINNGNIYGKGGDAGAGGNGTNSNTTGGSGAAGGPALSLGYNIAINNTNGNIFGGGGGGGGGNASYSCWFGNCTGIGGNGGGGGQGSSGGSGGAGGTGTTESGGSGGSGSPAGPGAGSTYSGQWGHSNGGNGGAWASAGAASPNGGAGGSGGAAILLNGKTITWLGGNDSTHVKGAVQ